MMKTKTMTTALALFISYVCCFGETNSEVNLVMSKHEEFSKSMNQLESAPDTKSRGKMLKKINDILDDKTVATQHLIDKEVARRFPIEYQYNKVLIFFKGKKKRSIKYVSTLSQIDTVRYVYNITAFNDSSVYTKGNFRYYETQGEAKVNAVHRPNKKSKRTYSSETRNLLTLVWKVNTKNNKAGIDTIYAEPVDFFNAELLEMQDRAKILVQKYYSNLPEKQAIPELKTAVVQNEFSSDHKPAPFKSMFDGKNSFIKISNLMITPVGATKYEEEPIFMIDVAREAYFDEEQLFGNKLKLRFAIAFNRDLTNEKIVKVEWMSGEPIEPEKLVGMNLKDAQKVGDLFAQRLAKFINTGAKDKGLAAEIISMFASGDAIFEISNVRTGKITERSISQYITGLTKSTPQPRKGKNLVEIVTDKPTAFSGSNIIEMKFRQHYDDGKYCDKTEKKIEMVYENRQYIIKRVSVIETRACK